MTKRASPYQEVLGVARGNSDVLKVREVVTRDVAGTRFPQHPMRTGAGVHWQVQALDTTGRDSLPIRYVGVDKASAMPKRQKNDVKRNLRRNRY